MPTPSANEEDRMRQVIEGFQRGKFRSLKAAMQHQKKELIPGFKINLGSSVLELFSSRVQ